MNEKMSDAMLQERIMQDIQSVITNLLTNTINKAHKSSTGNLLADASASDETEDLAAQMGIDDIKNFVNVMQRFIDNVNSMVRQIESGVEEPGSDEKFLDGYMETADSIIEIAAFSSRDKLTGLSNRYGFDNRMVLEWNRAIRDKVSLSLLIFGVQGFEDQKGEKHEEVIKYISKALEGSVKRSTDFLARWSEDEYATLLPMTDPNGAMIVAERICAEVEKLNRAGAEETHKGMSVSIGVCAHSPEPRDQPADFINKAHNAFIKAKEEGQNKIVFG